MNFGELKHYIDGLRASGQDVREHEVALYRKVAFPFVTLVMSLIGVPFAVTTGRRGAMYGVGVGIVLALVYWTMISVFAAFGAGGLMPPMMAAWAPNALFGAAAVYLLLTVRTEQRGAGRQASARHPQLVEGHRASRAGPGVHGVDDHEQRRDVGQRQPRRRRGVDGEKRVE
jgi:hypothetical protein